MSATESADDQGANFLFDVLAYDAPVEQGD